MANKAKKVTIDAAFCIKTRKRIGLTQLYFWKHLGVTQSGGSRYESGRRIPAPTRKLIYAVYVLGNVHPADLAAAV